MNCRDIDRMSTKDKLKIRTPDGLTLYMELPEDNADQIEEQSVPRNLRGASGGHESGLPPKPGRSKELTIDSVDTKPPLDHWFIEVVPGQLSDVANRMSFAIDLLLAAAARPR